MIEPFVDECVREEDGRKVLSYGLGSYGYDIRLAENQCFVFGMTPKGWNDVKAFDAKRNLNKLDLKEDDSGKYFWMPPHSYVLGVAEEAHQAAPGHHRGGRWESLPTLGSAFCATSLRQRLAGRAISPWRLPT